MQSYHVYDTRDDTNLGGRHFCKTLVQAQGAAKTYVDDVRPDVRIQLVEVKTDSASIHLYLNGTQPAIAELTPLRTWKLSSRGGLVELGPDGKPAKDSDKEQA